MRAVVLVALLEEAFAVRIPARDYPELRSYAAVRDYLGSRRRRPRLSAKVRRHAR